MSELDPKLTFESFVVGPSNRLAVAAAKRAAESPGASYNPLFIYSASGLGKSHLLMGVAHSAEKHHPDSSLHYQTLEQYLDDLAEALQEGTKDEMRDRLRALDVLLLDDVQFLADQPEAQEMLLTTLDSLTGSGSQIVLASDRPPSEINGLDERLVSRFSGGLIVDISAPDYETRVAILLRKTKDREQELQPGVAEALARIPLKNVRELQGALNRVLAVQELEGRPVAADEVPGLMGERVDSSSDEELGEFLDEVSTTLAEVVEASEEEWRRTLREVAEAAEQGGFVSKRVRSLLEQKAEPEDWKEVAERFQTAVARLAEIDDELDRLGNPWPDAAAGVLRDPDRLDEAEALLASVIERVRPFGVLKPGPALDELAGRAPDLVLRASGQLIQEERPEFNPLYLWSENANAPRAILAATGRSYADAHPDHRMAVVSVKDFAEEFIRALSDGVAGAWRERWWTVDLLLVHDAEALSGMERAQDEFFHLFEALKRRGSRVMIVADRAPSSIGRIDERLRTRFEGGLVLQVEDSTITPSEADLTLDVPPEPAPELAEEPVEIPVGAGVGGEAGVPRAPGVASDAGGGVPAAGASEGEGGTGSGRWIPTPENVVWFWPDPYARLVEDLE